MLRNWLWSILKSMSWILNEVLILNAQESRRLWKRHATVIILNEVLSLNAQEFPQHWAMWPRIWFLNEVLSLNAQESVSTVFSTRCTHHPQWSPKLECSGIYPSSASLADNVRPQWSPKLECSGMFFCQPFWRHKYFPQWSPKLECSGIARCSSSCM